MIFYERIQRKKLKKIETHTTINFQKICKKTFTRYYIPSCYFLFFVWKHNIQHTIGSWQTHTPHLSNIFLWKQKKLFNIAKLEEKTNKPFFFCFLEPYLSNKLSYLCFWWFYKMLYILNKTHTFVIIMGLWGLRYFWIKKNGIQTIHNFMHHIKSYVVFNS